MSQACLLKTDCPQWERSAVAALVDRYSERVPRYTSYPTAPHFNATVTADVYRRWLSELDADDAVSLYLHVPFCDRLCWYCGCQTTVVHNRAPVADYVDRLIAELDLVRSAIGRRLPLQAVHFGGGTPNILRPADLNRIFSALRAAFDLRPDAEIAAEVDPRVLSGEWIAAAVANGLNRASIGVQDISPKVQAAINRVQPYEQTAWAIKAFRDAGVRSINADLMYGLPHQTVDGVVDTVDRILALAPDRVAIFGYAHVPWMKPAQKQLPEDALPNAHARFAQNEAAAQRLVERGYVRIGFDHFARPEDPLASGQVSRNFQGYTSDSAKTLIGLGPSAIGRLPQGFVQNAPATPAWREAIAQGRFATVRGLPLSGDDEFRGDIISRLMCDLRVDLAAVAQEHAMTLSDVERDLAGLAPLVADGLVVRRGPQIVVTERGRPFVRSVCAVFDRYLGLGNARHSAGV